MKKRAKMKIRKIRILRSWLLSVTTVTLIILGDNDYISDSVFKLCGVLLVIAFILYASITREETKKK